MPKDGDEGRGMDTEYKKGNPSAQNDGRRWYHNRLPGVTVGLKQ
jgi:hypothetical protein